MVKERLRDNTFKKCDLHVHSSSDYSRKYSKDAFFKTVLDSDLDVVAITDHNSVDGPLLQDLSSLMEAGGKILFGGVEVNVKLRQETIDARKLFVPEGHKGEYFHAIVWCSIEDVESLASRIDNLFLQSKIVSASDLECLEKGTLTRKSYSAKTQGKAIFLESLQDSLSAMPHFFVPHENKGDRNLSDYLPNRNSEGKFCRENEEYKDRLLYYSHAMAVEGGDKSHRHISLPMKNSLETTVASLFFSDADEKTIFIGDRYSWIDFDGNLESLLLAVSDPESRIKTSDTCPNLPQLNTDSYLESLSFDIVDADGNAHKKHLNFAPGYNGIVGSRGSGKSLLAHILNHSGLSEYKDIIAPDSIRYTMSGGMPTADRPRCLYLHQGELADIFSEQGYSSIPLLTEYVEPTKEEASDASGRALSKLEQLICLQIDLLKAFTKRYPTGTVSLDYLNSPEPSGISIASADNMPGSDKEKIRNIATDLSAAQEVTESARKKVAAIKAMASYVENEALFLSIRKELATVDSLMQETVERIGRLSTLLEGCPAELFTLRDSLTSQLKELIAEYNRKDSSNGRVDYLNKESRATTFLDDLLILRVSLANLYRLSEECHEKLLSPIDPIELTVGESDIRIILGYQDVSSYGDHAISSLKGNLTCSSDGLIRACLHSNEPTTAKKLFNGSKIRNTRDDVCAYLDKYGDLLKREIRDAKTMMTTVELDGKPIDKMSPGTQAHALLKLFLHDNITNAGYTFVILDQPEDNLDVNTIKDFLVSRIKQLKLNVQFFVVSHSAPVIVNGDARRVVVCTEENGVIDYAQGTINDEKTKRIVADVLDGGELYLKMRLSKYNFQVGDKR